MKNKGPHSIRQYGMTLLMTAVITLIGSVLVPWTNAQSIGFLYLLGVMIASAAFRQGPIFFSAGLGALCWNFFFLSPQFTLHISTAQDLIVYGAFFFVASFGGFFSARLRKHEQLLRLKEESERLAQALINSISHEMRTPLTVILGNAAVLESLIEEKEGAPLRTSMNEIRSASERLNQVVENLLDMSRIEGGHLAPKQEVFALEELLMHTLQRLHPESRNHEVLVSKVDGTEWEDLILGDFKLLDHAIGNLVSNSLRYAPPKTKIKIAIFSSSDQVILTVNDQGAGIPLAYREKIFEKFFRIPGTRTNGTGLGLSIVKGILDIHHASIRVIDSPHETGATFEIRFPKASLPENVRKEWR